LETLHQERRSARRGQRRTNQKNKTPHQFPPAGRKMLPCHSHCQAASGRWRDLVFAFGGAGTTRAAAGTRSRSFVVRDRERRGSIGADRRRKHVERQAVVAAVQARLSLGPLPFSTVAFTGRAFVAVEAAGLAVAALRPRSPILTLLALLALGPLVTFGSFRLAGLDELLVALILVHVLIA